MWSRVLKWQRATPLNAGLNISSTVVAEEKKREEGGRHHYMKEKEKQKNKKKEGKRKTLFAGGAREKEEKGRKRKRTKRRKKKGRKGRKKNRGVDGREDIISACACTASDVTAARQRTTTVYELHLFMLYRGCAGVRARALPMAAHYLLLLAACSADSIARTSDLALIISSIRLACIRRTISRWWWPGFARLRAAGVGHCAFRTQFENHPHH